MTNAETDYVRVGNPRGSSRLLLVCEHASNAIPAHFEGLGLNEAARTSHAAWDIGALGLATALAGALDATLVAAGVSRLVYDCNRPLSDPTATPAQSEIYAIPGNEGLSEDARVDRARKFYVPFHDTVQTLLSSGRFDAIVTIHSFTPLFHGQKREVEVGLLHDEDSRLADAMLDLAAAHIDKDIRRNAPYGAEDGVMHSLREYGIKNNLLNVMIEVRNDLIAAEGDQQQLAQKFAPWLCAAYERARHAEQVT